jgi:hypothetical protein
MLLSRHSAASDAASPSIVARVLERLGLIRQLSLRVAGFALRVAMISRAVRTAGIAIRFWHFMALGLD